MTTGSCVDCGESVAAKHRGWLPRRCKRCKRRNATERQRAWRESNPERARFHGRRRPRTDDEKRTRSACALEVLYGLTVEQLRAGRARSALALPNGPGSRGGRFHIDHDHATGTGPRPALWQVQHPPSDCWATIQSGSLPLSSTCGKPAATRER